MKKIAEPNLCRDILRKWGEIDPLLTKGQKIAISYRYNGFRIYSYSEIAKIVGCNRSNVWLHEKRAIKKIKRFLELN